jgi:hypothetical protein
MAIILKQYIKLGKLFHRPVKILVEKDFASHISRLAAAGYSQGSDGLFGGNYQTYDSETIYFVRGRN